MILSHLIFNSLKTKILSHTDIKIFQFLNINNSMQKPYLWQDKDVEVCKPIYITLWKSKSKKVPEVCQTIASQLVQMENSKRMDSHVHSMCFPLCLLLQGFVYMLAAIVWHESYLELCHHQRHKMCCKKLLVPFVVLMFISTAVFPCSSRQSTNFV